MATAPTLPARTDEHVDPVPYRFSIDQYQRMIDADVFADTKCELLEGMVVPKATQNPRHGSAIRRLARRLSAMLNEDWDLCTQSPISLVVSVPEPDIAIAKGPGRISDRASRFPSFWPEGRSADSASAN